MITSGIFKDGATRFTSLNNIGTSVNLNEVLDQPIQALYFGGTGDLSVIDSDGKSTTFLAIPAGAILNIRPASITAWTGVGGLSEVIILQ